MARRGRRPGPTQTRGQILDVARRQFAERGYNKTTIRSIAAEAEVHPALLNHYFDTKHELYREALDLPVDPTEVLVRLLDQTPREEFAEALARHFISTWRDPQTGAWMRTLARQNLAEPEGLALTRAHLQSLVIPRIATTLDIPPANAAAGFASLLGITWADSLIGVTQLTQLSADALVALIVPILNAQFRASS
jgi:AcrR family transcriptional regulator